MRFPFPSARVVALVVACDPGVGTRLRGHLRAAGFVVVVAADAGMVRTILSGILFDVVLVHYGDPLLDEVRSLVDGAAPLITVDGELDANALLARLLQPGGN